MNSPRSAPRRSHFVQLLAVAGAISSAQLAAQVTPPPPRQGAALLKTDLMGVFAHPDDETGMAATLAAYARGRDAVVANVYCTRGEGGGNMVGTQWGPSLGVLREAELRDCLARLGVRYCHFLDRADFAYTESLSITIEKWGKEETLRRLVRLVRALRPEVIVTMNPAPTPGQHGNHQAAGLLATEAFDAAADPTRFPEQLRTEGLTVWRPRKLYYGAFGALGPRCVIDLTAPLPGGMNAAQIAGEALSNHRSQAFGGMLSSPWFRRMTNQSFLLVKSVVPFLDAETDLLRGLPVADATPPRVFHPNDAPSAGALTLDFVPRPAVGNYRRWVREQRIDHVAPSFTTDLPVVAGEASSVRLELQNVGSSPVDGAVDFSVPEGWKVEPATMRVRLAAGSFKQLTVRATAPAGTQTDAEVRASAHLGPTNVSATARLHPVPYLRISRVASAPTLEAGDDAAGWAALAAHAIPHTNTWQGIARDDADCSGTFRLVHDRRTLFVEVRVRDDQVVSNIEPNDIRGHWRSDSVELCFDPAAGAEHTLGCYKLGIFPFDTTGHVRAARDADARQGPIEETAPGTRVVSWKTADGYGIRAAIPLAEIGLNPAKPRRLGLNVLIYDGDKADAAPGENIGKTRLAWSRSGVQGRPEDWGRADLE